MTKLETVFIVAATGGLTLMLAWLVAAWRKRHAQRGLTGLYGLALAVGLLLRLSLTWWMPAYFAPDEQPHFKYVAYVYERHELPVQTAATNAPSNDWEYYQPPLYYLLAQPFYAVGQAGGGDMGALLAVRLYSVLLWLLGAVAMRHVVRQLPIFSEGQKALAFVLFTLLPGQVVASASVNNDNLAVPLAWVVLAYATLAAPRGLYAAVLGAMLGCLINTKLTGALAFAYVVLLGMMRAWQDPRRWLHHSLSPLLACAIGTLVWVPMAWRNMALYGSLTAEAVANVPRQWAGLGEAISFNLGYMARTFWASAGPSHNISHGFPVVGYGLTALAAYGWLRRERSGPVRPPVYALAGAMGLNVLLVWHMGLAYGQGQGRFFFAMMPAIAYALAVGVQGSKVGAWLLQRPYPIVAAAMVYASTFAAFSVATANRLLNL